MHIKISASRKACWGCKRKYYWKYLCRLVPNRIHYAAAVGTAFHKGAERFAKTRNKELAAVTAIRHFGNLRLNKYQDEQHILMAKAAAMVWAYCGLVEKFGIVYSEQYLECKITDDISICGIIDGVLCKDFHYPPYFRAHHAGLELKTKSQIGGKVAEVLKNSDQNKFYFFLIDKCLPLVKVEKMRYIVIRRPALRLKKHEDVQEYRARLFDAIDTQYDKYIMEGDVKKEDIQMDTWIEGVKQVGYEILASMDYQEKYLHADMFHPENLAYWYTNDEYCLMNNWVCEYLDLCNYPLPQTLNQYEERDATYDHEKTEKRH